MVDMKVNLGGLEMATPVTVASGTFGYGTEYLGLLDYSKLGAVTVKGIRMEPWEGNALPRHVEVPGGLVNAIGLQGPGVEAFVNAYIPTYRRMAGETRPPLIVNIWGGSAEGYRDVAARLDGVADVGALEMNVSCPNVKEGGHTFGQDPKVLESLVALVRGATKKPLIVKLAPNVPDFTPYVKACENGGANAISLINTIPAMVIDIETRKPVLANKSGGLSGRAVHPVAVKCVWEAAKATKLPILAMGGVYTAKDAIEFLLAGATAVAVGTATFTEPATAARVCDGIREYCERKNLTLADLKLA